MEAQIRFYENKLAYETDPSDLFEMLNAGQAVTVHRRAPSRSLCPRTHPRRRQPAAPAK